MGVVALSLVSFDRAEEGQSGVSDGQEGLRSSADADSEASRLWRTGRRIGLSRYRGRADDMTLGTWAASTGTVAYILLERAIENRWARPWILQGPPESPDKILH